MDHHIAFKFSKCYRPIQIVQNLLRRLLGIAEHITFDFLQIIVYKEVKRSLQFRLWRSVLGMNFSWLLYHFWRDTLYLVRTLFACFEIVYGSHLKFLLNQINKKDKLTIIHQIIDIIIFFFFAIFYDVFYFKNKLFG